MMAVMSITLKMTVIQSMKIVNQITTLKERNIMKMTKESPLHKLKKMLPPKQKQMPKE